MLRLTVLLLFILLSPARGILLTQPGQSTTSIRC
jgi:hypothetical protein